MKAATVAARAALLVRIFLGGVYLVAGALKVADPGKFAEAVGNFRLVPHELVNLVAIILPWIEITSGLLLISGVWLKASAWLINAMTVAFIAGITSAVVRGLNIECGCFGTVGGRQVGLMAIVEDMALLACGLWLIWRTRTTPAQPANPQMAVPSPTT